VAPETRLWGDSTFQTGGSCCEWLREVPGGTRRRSAGSRHL